MVSRLSHPHGSTRLTIQNRPIDRAGFGVCAPVLHHYKILPCGGWTQGELRLPTGGFSALNALSFVVVQLQSDGLSPTGSTGHQLIFSTGVQVDGKGLERPTAKAHGSGVSHRPSFAIRLPNFGLQTAFRLCIRGIARWRGFWGFTTGQYATNTKDLQSHKDSIFADGVSRRAVRGMSHFCGVWGV